MFYVYMIDFKSTRPYIQKLNSQSVVDEEIILLNDNRTSHLPCYVIIIYFIYQNTAQEK